MPRRRRDHRRQGTGAGEGAPLRIGGAVRRGPAAPPARRADPGAAGDHDLPAAQAGAPAPAAGGGRGARGRRACSSAPCSRPGRPRWPRAQRDRALVAERQAQEVNEFLRDMLGAADPGRGAGCRRHGASRCSTPRRRPWATASPTTRRWRLAVRTVAGRELRVPRSARRGRRPRCTRVLDMARDPLWRARTCRPSTRMSFLALMLPGAGPAGGGRVAGAGARATALRRHMAWSIPTRSRRPTISRSSTSTSGDYAEGGGPAARVPGASVQATGEDDEQTLNYLANLASGRSSSQGRARGGGALLSTGPGRTDGASSARGIPRRWRAAIRLAMLALGAGPPGGGRVDPGGRWSRSPPEVLGEDHPTVVTLHQQPGRAPVQRPARRRGAPAGAAACTTPARGIVDHGTATPSRPRRPWPARSRGWDVSHRRSRSTSRPSPSVAQASATTTRDDRGGQQPRLPLPQPGAVRRGRAALPRGLAGLPRRPRRQAPEHADHRQQSGQYSTTRWAASPRPSRSTPRCWPACGETLPPDHWLLGTVMVREGVVPERTGPPRGGRTAAACRATGCSSEALGAGEPAHAARGRGAGGPVPRLGSRAGGEDLAGAPD